MDYKTKKELPFTKEGTRVFIYSNVTEQHYAPMLIYADGTIEIRESFIIDFLSKGWIEEVKPREYFIGIHETGESLHDTYEEAKNWMQNLKLTDKIIKVREVIE